MSALPPVWNRNFSRRADDPTSVVAELPRRHVPLQIGARWSTGHAIVRDPVTGAYEERNPPMEGAALDVQSALLTQRRNNRSRYWLALPVLLIGTYIFCRVMWP